MEDCAHVDTVGGGGAVTVNLRSSPTVSAPNSFHHCWIGGLDCVGVLFE